MSVPAEKVQNINPNALKLAESMIRGKITNQRKIKTQAGPLYLTLVILPAADEFTSPSTVEVRSSEKLGDVQDTVSLKVKLSGFRRQYKYTDKESGEIQNVTTADMSLSVVQ